MSDPVMSRNLFKICIVCEHLLTFNSIDILSNRHSGISYCDPESFFLSLSREPKRFRQHLFAQYQVPVCYSRFCCGDKMLDSNTKKFSPFSSVGHLLYLNQHLFSKFQFNTSESRSKLFTCRTRSISNCFRS